MSDILRNIAKAEVLTLASLVNYSEGQVVSKTLVQNKGVGLTLFAFAKGEGISTHEALRMKFRSGERINANDLKYLQNSHHNQELVKFIVRRILKNNFKLRAPAVARIEPAH